MEVATASTAVHIAMYSPIFTPARTKRVLMTGLPTLNRSTTAQTPATRRDRLLKRVTDLLRALPLSRMALQGIQALCAEDTSNSAGCRYCGCTCRVQNQNRLEVLELRGIPQPHHCLGCSQEVKNTELCESCQSQSLEDYCAYVKVEVQTDGFVRLPNLTPPRRVSPDPPASTRPRRSAPLQVTVSAGSDFAHFQGPGPHLCRLVLQNLAEERTTQHMRSTTMDSRISQPEGEVNALEAETVIQEMVDSLERSKRSFVQPGTADRGLERLLRVFAGVERALWRQQPECAMAMEFLVSGAVLVCEAVAASHYEVLESMEAQSSQEKSAQMRNLSETVSRLQSELVSVRLAAASEVSALRHTVQTYEQRLQMIFCALRPDRAL